MAITSRISKIIKPAGFFTKAGKIGIRARVAQELLDTGKGITNLGLKILHPKLRERIPSPELKAIKILTSTLGDQVNNPLQGILGYAQLLRSELKEMGGIDQNVLDEDLESIEAETKRIIETVKMIRDKEKLHTEPYNQYGEEMIDLVKTSFNLDKILEYKKQVTIILDAENKIIKFNPAAQTHYGIKEEEAIGKKYFGVLPASLEKMAILRTLKVAKEKGDAREITNILISRGKCGSFETWTTALFDWRKRLLGYYIEQRELPETLKMRDR